MTIANSPPYTLTNGTTADATQVMANFTQLISNVNANAAANGANSDITSLTGITTPLGRTYGGSQYFVGGTSTGSGNAQVVTPTVPTGFALTAGAMVFFIAGFTNTSATTFNIGGTGVKNVFRQIATGAAACVGGEIVAGQIVCAAYDGTQYQLITNAAVNTAILRSLAALSVVSGDLIYGSGAAAVSRLPVGTNGQILTLAAGFPSWAANTAAASQAQMGAGSDLVTFVAPGTVKYAPGVAKAFVSFTPAASPALTLANNVSGVVRNGTGDFTITFSTAFSSANYICSGLIYDSAAIRSLLIQPYGMTTTTCSVHVFNTSSGAVSNSFINCQMLFLGDQ